MTLLSFGGISKYATDMLPFGAGFDPSKLSPESLQKLSELIRELPPENLQKIQTLMHNSMAGFDTRAEIAEFEKNLPSGFREKMARLMYEVHGAVPPTAPSSPASVTSAEPPKNIDEARITVLRGVASGAIAPEEALRVLFPEGDAS